MNVVYEFHSKLQLSAVVACQRIGPGRPAMVFEFEVFKKYVQDEAEDDSKDEPNEPNPKHFFKEMVNWFHGLTPGEAP